jgi:hypothetical protein
MTAAAGTVVSCTVFLPNGADQALQVPQTLIDQLHTRVESPSCMWIAVLPACTAQTYASTVHPVCQSHSKSAEVQHNWYRHCSTLWLIALLPACSISLPVDCADCASAEIANQSVGSSIDRTVQSANSSIQLLSWPSSPMFCIRHSYTAATLAALCAAASIAACCLCVLHALSMPVCMQSSPVCHEVPVWAHVPNAKCF